MKTEIKKTITIELSEEEASYLHALIKSEDTGITGDAPFDETIHSFGTKLKKILMTLWRH